MKRLNPRRSLCTYYCDLDLAEAEGIIEEELLGSIEEAGDQMNAEHLKWSAVRKVVA